jgi:hypothetical protein
MKIKIAASMFALTAFTLLAQPSLPTTNSYIVPIANPYSGSWIYYTTDSISGLGYLNGASIPYVMTVSNNVVNYVNAATSGLATTNFVLMIGLNDTNNTTSVSNLVYLAAQSYANGIGLNATNNTTAVSNLVYVAAQSYANGIGLNATNNTTSVSNLVYLAAQNYANGIGANATNYTTAVSNLVYLAAQSYANSIGANATNYTTAVSNSLATATAGVSTWGTTTNKTGSAAPATVYYYYTNGYPMFGIISTN